MRVLSPLIGDIVELPKYMTDGSAGFDLRACIAERKVLAPGEVWLMPTGLAVHIADPTYAAILLPRSGLGHKHGIVLGNLVGLIDSDYQGELFVSLWNRSTSAHFVEPNDRMAQFVLVRVAQMEFNIIDTFNANTIRGSGGFGHTDVK